MSTSPQEVVEQFLQSLGPDFAGIAKTFDEYMTDDCVFENTGFPACEGKEACIKVLDGFRQLPATATMEAIKVEMRSIAAAGNTVLTERIDYVVDGEGNVTLTCPIMGTFEVRDGKIARWRDYFDSKPFFGA